MAGAQSRLQYQRTLSNAPSEIPEDAQHMYANRKEGMTCTIASEAPDEVSEIYIDGGNNDRPGYKLEARLSTFEIKDGHEGSNYRTHKFTDIKPFGPAYEMSIKNGDELVLINEDIFGPGITHNEVLQKFRSINLGECSKFKMVIRREIAPGCCGGSDEHPIIVNTKSQRLKKNRIEMTETSLNLYKVQGTQRYITITNRSIFTVTLDGDDIGMTTSKGLWKEEFISQGRNNTFRFLVTLCDHTRTWYITADRRGRVIPRSKADLFLLTKRGSCVIFQTKRGNYLAYDQVNDQLKVQEEEYLLEEIGVENKENT